MEREEVFRAYNLVREIGELNEVKEHYDDIVDWHIIHFLNEEGSLIAKIRPQRNKRFLALIDEIINELEKELKENIIYGNNRDKHRKNQRSL